MVILKNTTAKLSEARFFLGKLQELRAAATSGDPSKLNREPFAYYLSAFLGAARSIPWVLQNEEREKYDAWIDGWEKRRGVEIEPLLELTNKMRVDVTHREGQVKTKTVTELVPIITPMEPNCYQINILRVQALRLAQEGMPKTSSETHYVEMNGTDHEVVSLCEKYVSYLSDILQDFEREHLSQTHARLGKKS